MAQVKMRHYDLEVKTLSSLYGMLSAITVAQGFPNKEFEAYTKEQQKAIINELVSFWDEHAVSLSSEMKEIIYPYPKLNFNKLRETLISANNKYLNLTKARRDEWLAFAELFDKLTKDALIRFIDEDVFRHDLLFLPKSKTGNASFASGYTNSYRQFLHLENAVFSENYNTVSYDTDDSEIDVLENGFRLSFIQAGEVITVDFSDVRLETQLFNYAHSNRWDGAPWTQISESLTALEFKEHDLGIEFLNEKEKAILPLCKFSAIHNMNSPYQYFSGDAQANALFCDFAKRSGNDYIVKLTEQYVNAKLTIIDPRNGFPKKNKECKALIKELKKQESEALARSILSEIIASTSEYLTQAELYTKPEVLIESRKLVTEILTQRGYEGKYPNFRKMTSLKGIKLLEMQGQPVIVGHEKNMACLIDCYENSIDLNTLAMSYTISTIFLKKDEVHTFDSLDGYSGFFPYKNRRRARSLSPKLNYQDEGKVTYDLKDSVITAARIAECVKLSKEDRRSIASAGPGQYGCMSYGIMFLFAGLTFGLLFCPAMFLFALVLGAPVTAISSETPSFSEYFFSLLFEFPWWKMLLFCVMGFGIPMTIITAIAKRRG